MKRQMMDDGSDTTDSFPPLAEWPMEAWEPTCSQCSAMISGNAWICTDPECNRVYCTSCRTHLPPGEVHTLFAAEHVNDDEETEWAISTLGVPLWIHPPRAPQCDFMSDVWDAMIPMLSSVPPPSVIGSVLELVVVTIECTMEPIGEGNDEDADGTARVAAVLRNANRESPRFDHYFSLGGDAEHGPLTLDGPIFNSTPAWERYRAGQRVDVGSIAWQIRREHGWI